MCNCPFLRGMLLGLAAGLAAGVCLAEKHHVGKTRVGRTMQHMSCAVDGALNDLMRSVR